MARLEGKAAEIKSKICAILSNPSRTHDEIEAVWKEAKDYQASLPPEERSGFAWNSCMEGLFLLTDEAKEEK